MLSPQQTTKACVPSYRALCHVVLGFILCLVVVHSPFHPNGMEGLKVELVDVKLTEQGHAKSQSNHPSIVAPDLPIYSMKMCPSTKSLFDQSDLNKTIQEATNFHIHGGNLLSVARFKNQAVDFTLSTMNLTFITKGRASKAIPTVTDDHTANIKRFIQKNGVRRGGYGKPLPGEFAPPWPLLNEKRRMDVTEPWSAARYRASEGPKGHCKNLTKLRLDNTPEYEAKWICGDFSNCTVISIGSNDQWGMETALKAHGCTTHTFDCTLAGNVVKNRPPNSPNMHFHPHCISSKTYTENGRSYMTYGDMMALTNLTSSPTLLKLDVEGFEYEVLQKMLVDNYLLPLQIQIELHWGTKMVDVPWMLRTITSAELALFFGMMYTSGGYLPMHRVDACPVCQEVLFGKVLC